MTIKVSGKCYNSKRCHGCLKNVTGLEQVGTCATALDILKMLQFMHRSCINTTDTQVSRQACKPASKQGSQLENPELATEHGSTHSLQEQLTCQQEQASTEQHLLYVAGQASGVVEVIWCVCHWQECPRGDELLVNWGDV